jgi:V8-like Glu-specific endopeptidase
MSVARIVRADHGAGTGFLIPGNRLVTNNHVLPDADKARTAVAQFNFQKMVDGTSAIPVDVALNPDAFFRTSVEDDWTVVELAENANEKWGAIELVATPIEKDAFVNIIQHPGGAQKHVSISPNVVTYSGEDRVQYLTDTLPGSSGSPVFDSEWNLVALHHSGGWMKEPGSFSKSTLFRNEGIAIQKVIDGLE